MNHNPKAAFNSKFVTENGGFRSMLATWPNLPNLFPAYTISYSAATGKPIENGKKKLFVLLVLLLLLITSLAASLVLAFLWFNAIQSDYSPNDASKIAASLDQNSLLDKHHVRPSNSVSYKPAPNLSPDHLDSHLNNHNSNLNPNSNPNLNGRLNHHPSGHPTASHPTASHPTHSIRTQVTNRRPPTAGHPVSPVNERFKPMNQQPPARTSTTPASATSEATESTNDDDGFGETGGDAPAATNPNAQPPTPDAKDDERLINYYNKNFKNELDRDRSNKIRHEEKLDGEFVEHHTVSDVPDDESETRELSPEIAPGTNNESPTGSANDPPMKPMAPTEDYSRAENLYLPEPLASLRTKQFCNPSAYLGAPLRNASYECRSSPNPALISSYFCNDKFVIVAKINALRETAVGQATGPNERQLLSKYDVHIERILKRSPFLSVAFKKQGLTTNITLDLSVLSEELQTSGTTSCFGQPLELRTGQTYLLSGKISGLSAISNNCDLQVDWLNDLDDEQRNQLVNWSASRTTFAHC